MTVLPVRDLVPAALRDWWARTGHYPGRTLYDLFAEHAVAHPDRVAVIDDDGEITYAQLQATTLRLAGALRRDGVAPGEVIAVQLPNGWRPVAVDLAAAAIGAVVLPYPVGRGRRDTLTLLRRSRAAVAVVAHKVGDHHYADTLATLRPELPDLRTVLVAGLDGPDSLEGWLADGAPLATPVATSASAPARILVSSGSEAAPKMIVYSHDALAGGRGAFIAALHQSDEPMRNLFLVPLASSFGSSGSAVTIARHGGTLLVQSRFDAGRALELIDTHQPSLVFGVPTMFTMMLDHPRLATTSTASLRAVVAGGSRVDPATVQSCRDRFDAAFVNCYGSADGVNCTTDPLDPPAAVHDAVGRPNPAVATVRVVGDDDTDVAPGEVGEIWGLGPMSPLCYVDPEFDERYRVEGGWVRTGDLGRVDADGFLHVVGRRNEIIIRGGRNLSPVEVELLIAQHPAVRQVACVGVPDRLMGERMAACIAVRDGADAPTLTELAGYLTDTHGLEHAKLPERLAVLDTLPLSAAGKVDKRWLRERLIGQDE
ncbi:class I adenylate-forming enzyme family protein [Micromonospora sp. WMMD1155]|uniref:class I adenylate-forming enzyme family protein n=1 Tax=Micromonospora sp. WMMD1155 TaxID=3016094 RepID=UPI00249AFAE8|nr:class I adenylate-forming enzyme family protein [Micromonospora sp. WMMD1155]WFE53144.1 class I adenylate-forming enzyme family protein [Micromonospora sp. WMMD1155]